ncbi:MAG: putative toxin-antitoxin system toxin component, PIN family [Butyrivibrio sp.]|nr:putative toxin-antitoxin system toxin component, PIN family [Butyrivibrio sp.]
MKYYAVIDTNVLVSAMLKWTSIPGNIIELTLSGTIVPLLNERIVKEYKEVLGRLKFHLTDEIIDSVVDEMELLGIYVDANELDLVFPDPKDRVFYEVVMEERKSEEAYLVTGNIRHFLAKPYVVTPRQMLDIIIGNMEN